MSLQWIHNPHSKCEGRKQNHCVPHQECWKSQEACCSCWSKQNTPLGTNSPCFLCFVPSFPLICLKVFTSCYRDKKNDHWVVTEQHKMSRSRKTDMALTLVTDTKNTLIITKAINKCICVGGFCFIVTAQKLRHSLIKYFIRYWYRIHKYYVCVTSCWCYYLL